MAATMPNDQKPRRKRYRYKIDHDKKVRVNGPGWVTLSSDGKHVHFTPDRGPVDLASSTKLQFPVDKGG